MNKFNSVSRTMSPLRLVVSSILVAGFFAMSHTVKAVDYDSSPNTETPCTTGNCGKKGGCGAGGCGKGLCPGKSSSNGGGGGCGGNGGCGTNGSGGNGGNGGNGNVDPNSPEGKALKNATGSLDENLKKADASEKAVGEPLEAGKASLKKVDEANQALSGAVNRAPSEIKTAVGGLADEMGNAAGEMQKQVDPFQKRVEKGIGEAKAGNPTESKKTAGENTELEASAKAATTLKTKADEIKKKVDAAIEAAKKAPAKEGAPANEKKEGDEAVEKSGTAIKKHADAVVAAAQDAHAKLKDASNRFHQAVEDRNKAESQKRTKEALDKQYSKRGSMDNMSKDEFEQRAKNGTLAKKTVLFFHADFCGPCNHALGVAGDGGPNYWANTANANKDPDIEYRIVGPTDHDPDGAYLASQFGVHGIPHMVVVDNNGKYLMDDIALADDLPGLANKVKGLKTR